MYNHPYAVGNAARDINTNINIMHRLIKDIALVENIEQLEAVSALIDENGKPLAMYGTIQDVTERKQLEEQLHIRQRMDSVGTLAGGIAHDFNNILSGIVGNIGLLNRYSENLSEAQKKWLIEADKSCDRATN